MAELIYELEGAKGRTMKVFDDKVVLAVALQGVENDRSDFVVHFIFSPKAFLYKY